MSTNGRAETAPVRERIVVGVDASPGSVRALRWAAEQAHRLGWELHVIHAWTVPSYPFIDPQLVTETARAAAQQTIDRTLQDAFGADEPDVTTTTRLVHGPAPHALTLAAEDAGMLVVGSRGHGEVAGMLLGSVAMHLAAHAPCPLVVVPAPRHGRERRAEPAVESTYPAALL